MSITTSNFDNAVNLVREAWIKVQADAYDIPLEPATAEADKQAVLSRYQPIFSLEHLPKLTEAEFRSFLMFSNNKHWSGLHRMGPRICRNMPALRQALATLLDERQPLETRYDQCIGRISGMGRAIGTAILLVAHPDQYGVWNNTSEAGLKRVDMWPSFSRGESEGTQYAKINERLVAIAEAVGVDLWILDTLWYFIVYDENEPQEAQAILAPEIEPSTEEDEVVTAGQVFGLERHLQDFLWLNWDELDLGKEWRRYQEPGNETAGYEFACSVGRIDILAQHRANGDWLVVELKRAQSSDDTLGQLLRYMGWIRQHLATSTETVHGLIIAHMVTDQLRYATQMVNNVSCQEYQVQFTLRDLAGLS